MRAEKTTRPFLRSSEFHWQEGHTVHASGEEANRFAKKIQGIYADFVRKQLCIPVITGAKTPNERFAGADQTYTLEAIMQDGKALQCATSHDLGQNFSKVYGIKFQDNQNNISFAHQTSWGISTRIIGAMIMIHSDDNGLVLPPACAPHQVAVLTLFADKNPQVLDAAKKIQKNLSKRFRVLVDASDKGLGYKLAEQEVLGTCLRLELGPRDLQDGTVTLSNRLDGTKSKVAITDLKKTVAAELRSYAKMLLERASVRQAPVYVKTKQEFVRALGQGGFVAAPWGGDAADEAFLKQETTATARCIPYKGLKRVGKGTKCFFTGKPAKEYVLFAIAY